MPSSRLIANPPAGVGAVSKLQCQYPGVPDSYYGFLLTSNGASCRAVEPAIEWTLWRAEDVVLLNFDQQVSQDLPGWLAIGTAADGALLAFQQDDDSGAVFRIPPRGASERTPVLLAESFSDYLGLPA